ncbi:hypothetical protein [Nostoc sphaeroides]|uniref:hypothetical protein n=1 Tax=Nostoc sphaeroides TaxID=446679 RepID=UPI0030B8D09F
MSGITITAERLKTIAFSRPYFKAGLAMSTTGYAYAVREDNENIKDFNSLKGKKNRCPNWFHWGRFCQNHPQRQN